MSLDMEITEALEISRTAADLGDRATCIEGIERAAGVAAVQARMQGAGQDWCEDCGEDMQPERRDQVPYAIRCVPCQTVHERKTGGVRRG